MRAIRRPIARRRRWSSAAPSPTTPCHIDNFLIADPPLKQVVSHTIEAGLRGEFSGGAAAAAAASRARRPSRSSRMAGGCAGVSASSTPRTPTTSSMSRATAVPNFGFFPECRHHAAPGRRGQGRPELESLDRLRQLHLRRRDLSELDVRRQQPDGDTARRRHINVMPGDHIPGIPAHRFKLGAEYADHRRLEARRRSQLLRQPVSTARRHQPLSEGAGLLGRQPAHVLPNDEERRGVRAGATTCSTSTTTPRAPSSIPAASTILRATPIPMCSA